MSINKLLSDEKFLLKIITLDKIEDVQKAFEEQGVKLTIEECEALGTIIKTAAEKKQTVLTSDDLENISGGTTGTTFTEALGNIGNEIKNVAIEVGEGAKLGIEYSPIRAVQAVMDEQNSEIPIAKKAGLVTGSLVIPAAVLGAWELAKFTKRKIGSWISSKKTK